MLKVAIATCSAHPNLYADDQSTLSALREQGIEAQVVVWDSNADWSQYTAVVIRSTWDYWLKHESFLSWLDGLARAGIRTFNPPDVIRENTRKTYLKRMEAAGIPTLPTLWLEHGTARTLQSCFAETGWKEAVLKPSVSGGAYRTYRILAAQAPQFEHQLSEMVGDSEAMLQPLAPSILNEGEYSFVYFSGHFSHAVLKRGPKEEFRIQRTFGGTVSPYSPNSAELHQAQEALEAYWKSSELLYARVDMIRDERDPSRLVLMELEATEPSLFFLSDGGNPGAAQRFARALRMKL